MAKKIRFPLEMKDGIEVRDIGELKENFSLEHVLVYLADGKLITWLRDRYQNEIADAVLALNREDADFHKKICDIFEVEYVESQEDIEKAMERKRKETLLKEVTDEEKFYEVVEQIAFTQDDLYDLLDGEETEIYLCGREFAIPLEKSGIHYIGINNPVAVIVSKEKVDFEEKGITFLGIQFDEKYAEILAAEVSFDEALKNDNKNVNDIPDILRDEELTELSGLADGLSDEAWRQINQLIDRMREYTDSFFQKALKRREGIPVFFTTSTGFYCVKGERRCDSRINIFGENEKVREIIEDFVNDIREHHKELKKDIMNSCIGYVRSIEDDIMIFIVEFKKIFNTYMFQECGEDARAYVQRGMVVVSNKNRMIKRFDDFHAIEKVEEYIQELFADPIDREGKLKQYFDMCTDKCDGFTIYNVIDSITDSVIENFDEACAVMVVRMEKLYQSILIDYCEGIRTELSVMRSNGRNKENLPGNLSGTIIGILSKNISRSFEGFEKNTESSSCNESVTDWWDRHLANAHKASDK